MSQLKKINNNNYIRAKVVMLATDKATQLILNRSNELYIPVISEIEVVKGNKELGKFQNLYITSDEEINEGDWYLSKVNNKPCKWTKDYSGTNGYGFKIIATTDKDINEPDKNIKNITYALLPEPSKEFIQAYIESYNNGNPITDILVEYEVNVLMEDGDALSNMFKLKTKKDNTITIVLKEDRLFTYKEMRSKAVDFAYYIHLQKLGDCSHEKHKQLFDEYIEPKL